MVVRKVGNRKVYNEGGVQYVHIRIVLPAGGGGPVMTSNLKHAAVSLDDLPACILDDWDDHVAYIAAPATVDVPDDVRAAGAGLFKSSGGSVEKLLSSAHCTELAHRHQPSRAPVDATAPRKVEAAFTFTGTGTLVHPFGDMGDAMWREAVAKAVTDMTAKFFSAGRVFYDTPPIGYAALEYPWLGHYLAVEWVGKLLVSVASRPFFLGTEEHRAITAALPAPTYGAPKYLPARSHWTRGPKDIQWAVHDGCYYELIPATRYAGTEFAAMHAAYRHLATLKDDGTCPPAARLALTARAVYGAQEVLVTMDAFDDAKACRDDAVLMPGRIQNAVAAAVAWLASRRIVYVDVRGPNVLLKRGTADDVRLTDFDDALVSPTPITNYADYMAAVGEFARELEDRFASICCVRMVGSGTFAELVVDLANEDMDAIRAALKAAFEALPVPPVVVAAVVRA